MKQIFIITFITLLMGFTNVHAQFTVVDPTNFGQSIINTTRNVIQTTSTANNMLNNFKETVKIYEQGKKYYDALKSVNNLVKDAKKVQRTILMVGEVSDIYINNFQKMLSDPYFETDELNAIAEGYIILLEESNIVLEELKTVVNITTLSMTDKDRIDVVNNCYNRAKDYRNLVQYYTHKNIGVSYLRAKKAGEAERVLALYGNPNDKYW